MVSFLKWKKIHKQESIKDLFISDEINFKKSIIPENAQQLEIFRNGKNTREQTTLAI